MTTNNGKNLKYPKRRSEIVSTLSAEFSTLPSGSRLPATAELCKRFNCAAMTIHRALGELEVRGEIYRIQGKGTFIPCRELKNIYILAPAPSGRWPNQNNLYDTVLNYAERKGIAVHIIYATVDNISWELDMSSLQRIPQGSSVIVPSLWYNYTFKFLQERQCKVVFFDESWDLAAYHFGEIAMQWHQLVMPIASSIAEAVRRFKAAGHTNILFVHHCDNCQATAIQAFRSALQQENIPHEQCLEMYGELNRVQSLHELFDSRFNEKTAYNAILARHPVYASAALATIKRYKRHIPRDFSMICLSETPQMRNSHITTISITPVEAAGCKAVDILCSNLPMPQRIHLDFEINDRGSV